MRVIVRVSVRVRVRIKVRVNVRVTCRGNVKVWVRVSAKISDSTRVYAYWASLVPLPSNTMIHCTLGTSFAF